MAELKIDVTKLVGRCCEMVLDETEYAGKTLREWINDITSGDYVPANVSANKAISMKQGYWKQVKKRIQMFVMWCGARMTTRGVDK